MRTFLSAIRRAVLSVVPTRYRSRLDRLSPGAERDVMAHHARGGL